MTSVRRSGDCGNSPKNSLLEDLTVAFATGERQILLAGTSADVRWEIVGQKQVAGKAAFVTALEELQAEPVAEITIQHVVSHGKAGAVNGEMRLASGERRAFCYVYAFSNAKGTQVREIRAYVLEIE